MHSLPWPTTDATVHTHSDTDPFVPMLWNRMLLSR